jgi:glycosyltransferase involved in cell wall biosynthesis
MRIYYFIHVVGRDTGNSGIPRVSRNLARVLNEMPDVELMPVRWDEPTSSVVHAEASFLETMRMHGGPELVESGFAGVPIHHDDRAGAEVAWLFIPEAPHLGLSSEKFRPTHLTYVAGYARLHGLRTAAIFHDAMPITHFGEENSSDPAALTFIIYTMGLASFDVIVPVSQASAEALTGLFGRCGLDWKPKQILQPILLPEEMVGLPRLAYLREWPREADLRREFCTWGTAFPHKNHLAIMEAFNALCERRPDLDLALNHVGLVDAQCVEAVRRLVRRSHGRIKLHGFTSDEELIGHIGRSHATVFVSRAEGYGLPLAESIWLGRPCITSNLAPMTEIAVGGGAMLVDPRSVTEIADAMERIATDPAVYSDLVKQLRQRPMRTWKEYGHDVRALLQRAATVQSEAPGTPYFTPEQRKREPQRVESFLFGLDDMHLVQELVQQGATQIARGVLTYRPMAPSFSRVDKKLPFVEHTISYGPYYTIGAGDFHFHVDGEITGRCRMRITSEDGKRTHLDLEVDSFDEDFVISAPEGMEKFEIVFLTTPTLDYFSLGSVSVTRLYTA